MGNFRMTIARKKLGIAFGALAAFGLVSATALPVGAAIGEGWVKTGDRIFSETSAGAFSESHTAYKLMVGARPISLLGAEIEYVDFGKAHRALSGVDLSSADVKMRGAAAFATLHLPVPVVDVYLKAGLSRLQTSANVRGSRPEVAICLVGTLDCGSFTRHSSTTDTHFAAGAGAQFKLGSWALRAEYERFAAGGGHPGLGAVGVTWTFL